jgi:RNA-directed DNA polymerase
VQFDVALPTVKDRIVQQAVRLVIEPIFEHGFADGSYGFVRSVGAMTLCGRSTS